MQVKPTAITIVQEMTTRGKQEGPRTQKVMVQVTVMAMGGEWNPAATMDTAKALTKVLVMIEIKVVQKKTMLTTNPQVRETLTNLQRTRIKVN